MDFAVSRPNKPKKVIVFTTPTCSWCRTAKKYLADHHVSFKEVDVSRDPAAARDLVNRTGQMGVPVILVGNKPVVGFDKAELDRLLSLN